MNSSQTAHKPLTLPPGIDFISRQQALDILEISRPQLTRYQETLNLVQVNGFDYSARDKGFSRKSLEILYLYRQLVRERGVEKALEKLIELTEGQDDDTGTQGSSGTSSKQTQASGFDFGGWCN